MGLTNYHTSTNNDNSAFVTKWEKPLGHILHHLDDPIFLQRTRFVRLTAVRRLAIIKYPGYSTAEPQALVYIISECVGKIAVEFGNHPKYSRASTYLNLTIQGIKCVEIAHAIKRSREHCSRYIRPQALCLLAHQFVLIIRSKPSVGIQELKYPGLGAVCGVYVKMPDGYAFPLGPFSPPS